MLQHQVQQGLIGSKSSCDRHNAGVVDGVVGQRQPLERGVDLEAFGSSSRPLIANITAADERELGVPHLRVPDMKIKGRNSVFSKLCASLESQQGYNLLRRMPCH